MIHAQMMVGPINLAGVICLVVGIALVLLRRWLVDTFALPGNYGPGGDRATEVSILLLGVVMIMAGLIGLMVGDPDG